MAPRSRALAVVGLAVPVIVVVAVVAGLVLNAGSGRRRSACRRGPAERDGDLPAAPADAQSLAQRDAARRRDAASEPQRRSPAPIRCSARTDG